MRPPPPEGWECDSDTLYLHSSGVRIERRVYRSKEGWFLIPVDLDRAVLEFSPDAQGLADAFAAFTPKPSDSKLAKKKEAAREDEEDEKGDEEEDDEDL